MDEHETEIITVDKHTRIKVSAKKIAGEYQLQSWSLVEEPAGSPLVVAWRRTIFNQVGVSVHMCRQMYPTMFPLTNEQIVYAILAMLKQWSLEELLTCEEKEIRESAKAFENALQTLRQSRSSHGQPIPDSGVPGDSG